MKHFALLGYPLGHSYSATIHNGLYDALGIDATYELKETAENELEAAINLLKDGTYNGYNVTIPYKVKIMQYLDEIAPEAKAIGAVNTVVYKDGKTIGYNTDYQGFIDELKTFGVDTNDKTIYILGSGGASHAVKKALEDLNAKPIIVSRFKRDDAITYEELEKIEKIDGIINTTPVGMYPVVDESPLSKEIASRAGFIVDIIFNPSRTRLMSFNDNSYNGLAMLIYQAISSDEIWLGKHVDKRKMFELIRGGFNE